MFICLAGWGGTISHEVELLRVETLEMLRWRTSAQALCLGYRIWVLNLGTLKPKHAACGPPPTGYPSSNFPFAAKMPTSCDVKKGDNLRIQPHVWRPLLVSLKGFMYSL